MDANKHRTTTTMILQRQLRHQQVAITECTHLQLHGRPIGPECTCDGLVQMVRAVNDGLGNRLITRTKPPSKVPADSAEVLRAYIPEFRQRVFRRYSLRRIRPLHGIHQRLQFVETVELLRARPSMSRIISLRQSDRVNAPR